MKRPFILIVGAAAGALLVAAAGASAHTGFTLTKAFGVHSGVFGDEATGARTETPEPNEMPEAAPTAEPTEAPEPADNETEVDNDNDTDVDNDTETNDEHGDATKATSSGEHDGGGGGDSKTENGD